MSARTLLAVLSALLVASTCYAQTPNEPNPSPREIEAMLYKAVAEERVRFVRKAYPLNDDQAKKLQEELKALVPEQINYMKSNEDRLRLRRTALAEVIPTQPTMSKETRDKLAEKYQDEIYEIHTNAPLSSTNAVKRAEKMLSKSQIDQGRATLARQFARALGGTPLDIENIDRLLLQPVKPAPPAKTRAQRRSNPKPTVSPTQARRNTKKDPKPTRPPPPTPKRSESKPAKPIEPAPPVDTWKQAVDEAVTKYGYSQAQKKSAERVFENCRERAEAHLKENEAALKEANQIADPAEKTGQLKQLNKPLDNLYHELSTRLDAIASLEQRHAAAAKEKKAKTEQDNQTNRADAPVSEAG